MTTTAMARLEMAVIAAHNDIYDWLTAREPGFVGTAPAHLLTAAHAAEAALHAARAAATKARMH